MKDIRIAKAQVIAAQAALTPEEAGVGETDYVIPEERELALGLLFSFVI